MKQKRDNYGITFHENIVARMFLKFSDKRVLFLHGDFFNKVNSGIVQMSNEVGT